MAAYCRPRLLATAMATPRKPTRPTTEGIDAFCAQFEHLCTRHAARQAFCHYLIGLLLSRERKRTTTVLASLVPGVNGDDGDAGSIGIFRSFFSSASGTQPDDFVLFVAPSHASKVGHTDSLHEGLAMYPRNPFQV